MGLFLYLLPWVCRYNNRFNVGANIIDLMDNSRFFVIASKSGAFDKFSQITHIKKAELSCEYFHHSHHVQLPRVRQKCIILRRY